MDRNAKVLHRVNKKGHGLEIGAGYGPFAPKKDGYNVHVIDHLDKEGLVQKYSIHDMPVENIEDVDFVWNGESYAQLTGKSHYYDWIIASHLIEHTPDLIGFIKSCQEVLKEDGVLSLVIPDARFCFDSFRPLSGISKVIDAHLQSNKEHTVGTIIEFSLDAVKKDSCIAWEEATATRGTYTFIHSQAESKKMIETAYSGEYVDSHSWCFTPHSFRLLIHDLNSLGFIKLKELEFFTTEGCEFFITLARNGQFLGLDRIAYLEKIREETWANVKLASLLRQRALKKIDHLTERIQNSLRYRLSMLSKK